MKTLLNIRSLGLPVVLTLVLSIGIGKQSVAADQSEAKDLAQVSLLTMEIGQASSTAMTEKNEEAFSRLRNHRRQLSATLETLRAGALKQQIAALTDNSSSLDRNISALLEQESMLRRFLTANKKVAELEATLLELSEEILVLTLDHQGKSREVMAATQLMMLSQRLAKNFNLLYLENTMETEAVFLIAKDSRTMHGLIREMIQGSQTLGLGPAHQETKLKLLQLADSFSEVESLVASTLKDLPQLFAMKRTSAIVQEQCGGLQMQLVRLLSARFELAQN